MRRPFASPFAILLLLAFAASCSDSTQQATAQTKPADDSQPARLAVGGQAPNFRLKDQHNAERTLEDLLADGKVALVFHRSADW